MAIMKNSIIIGLLLVSTFRFTSAKAQDAAVEIYTEGCSGGTCNNVNPTDLCRGSCTCSNGTCVEAA